MLRRYYFTNTNIYVSPFKRTINTAVEISKVLRYINEIVIVPQLSPDNAMVNTDDKFTNIYQTVIENVDSYRVLGDFW
jgi:phosphohistidine phosphatase SixA